MYNRRTGISDSGSMLKSLTVPDRSGGNVMVISNDFEIGYLLVVFALLGCILIGALLGALHLDGWHPNAIGAAAGALLCVALIEALPALT
jgi:hypothetical protein